MQISVYPVPSRPPVLRGTPPPLQQPAEVGGRPEGDLSVCLGPVPWLSQLNIRQETPVRSDVASDPGLEHDRLIRTIK